VEPGRCAVEATGPVVSPGGRYLAAMVRSHGLRLCLLDAVSMRRLKTLHLVSPGDSEIVGSFSFDETQFAFSSADRLHIVSIPSGLPISCSRIPGITTMGDVSWSPDGQSVALCAQSGSTSMVLLFSVKDGTFIRVVSDSLVHRQPSWSQDGSRLCFVTQRVPKGTHGCVATSISVFDITTREGSRILLAPWATHLSPHFGPGGEWLYFVANAEGIGRLYRYSFAESTFCALSRPEQLIWGPGPLSTVLTVSPRSGEVFCTQLQAGRFMLVRLGDQTCLKTNRCTKSNFLSAIALPPSGRPDQRVFR